MKQLGIEVVTEVAGLATGAVAGKVIGAIGYKVGSKIYPTVQAALDATFEARPGLKIALGKFSNTLIAGAEKFGNTAAGKAAIKADQWALRQEAKVMIGLQNRLGGLGEDLGAAHVPGSVAAKMEARAAKEAVRAEAQAVAKEVNQELISLDGLRQAILNRERKVINGDLEKFGFSGNRVVTLTEANQKTGRIGLNTELEGGIDYAHELYYSKVKDFSKNRTLVKEEIIEKNGGTRICSTFDDESIIQLRTIGKSGHPKVEITDTVKNIEEKITFKEDIRCKKVLQSQKAEFQ